VDMAPGVDLLLYAISTPLDFRFAVGNATADGADIITASIGLPSDGGDGSNPNKWYRDGTSPGAKKVSEATANGTFVTVAAGNQATSHWSGNYTSVNSTELVGTNLWFDLADPVDHIFPVIYESVMMFNSSGTGAMQACLPIFDEGTDYFASWNAWDKTIQDYDTFLYNFTMNEFLGLSSQAPQNPFVLKPLEFFSTQGLDDVCLVLASFNSTEDHFFHIDIGDSDFRDPSYITPARSVDTPADSPDVLAVGAISFNNTATLFSL